MSPAVATLERVEAALLRALDAVRAAREAEGAPSDVLRVAEAARLAGRTPSTVRRWAAEHGLGRLVGGRWLLSRERFAAFVEHDRPRRARGVSITDTPRCHDGNHAAPVVVMTMEPCPSWSS